MRIGLDIGSTTIKCVVLDEKNQILYQTYERHYSQIVEKTAELLGRIAAEVPGSREAYIAVSGSAGMGLADGCGLPFVQEVYATRAAANKLCPGVDVIVELGGEDAKILFLSGAMEVRMNGSCAGGTGAFIDQMATLLGVESAEMNGLAMEAQKTYRIASRCGVFAKTDVQPLLNQGARKEDIALSIFYAVVNQTVAGLAQGRPIKGNVLYLGGPLTFFPRLRQCFDDTLHITGTCPENSLYYVAMGAAFCADRQIDPAQAAEMAKQYSAKGNFDMFPPLFASQQEYEEFQARHAKAALERAELAGYTGKAYLGVDAGSTTVKTVLLSQEGKLLFESYQSNSRNPVPLVKAVLEQIYEACPSLNIAGATVTGYGEDLIKNAFHLDWGVVETVAHFTAAKTFMPDVDFVIDIGGQDMKCFKIKNGAIDNIFLNEACSSGCGSFLQTFANALGYSVQQFAAMGLLAAQPVNLGSRCTVFMNSSVKQAQKDGATVGDISAGLSISVVKNALYKVIRATTPEELGRRIVVQGGTFLNDAVLRAFEKELGCQVIRPDIAGLMGAYGAALLAREKSAARGDLPSTILTAEELKNFEHTVKVANCGLCSNNCQLTINQFGEGRRFIGGNRCERPLARGGAAKQEPMNMMAEKQKMLAAYQPVEGPRGSIGLPFGLNFYELLPFWHTFFTKLGFRVVVSPASTRDLYILGQCTIPSDTVCFPAKLMHGHTQWLIDQGIKTIFYPCMSYNLDEGLGDNHYNCPVVAYYPEVLAANMPDMEGVTFIKDYLGLHRPKDFPKHIFEVLQRELGGFTLKEVEEASRAAYAEYESDMTRLRRRGEEMIAAARAQGKPIIILVGRPYHADPEVNHGIDQLIAGFNVAVVTEDAILEGATKEPTGVLNQWTYHARLYAAARTACRNSDMNLVQLVSFGCGVDAITTDEVREILEGSGKIYTQIKIDEITNLGAVKIHLRSLLAALGLE